MTDRDKLNAKLLDIRKIVRNFKIRGKGVAGNLKEGFTVNPIRRTTQTPPTP